MKKSILNLKGAQVLTNAEQKNVIGGITKECSDNTQYITVVIGNCSSLGLYSIPGCSKKWCAA